MNKVNKKVWQMFVSWYEENVAKQDSPDRIWDAYQAFLAGYEHQKLAAVLGGPVAFGEQEGTR
jgi:hypothetical protein